MQHQVYNPYTHSFHSFGSPEPYGLGSLETMPRVSYLRRLTDIDGHTGLIYRLITASGLLRKQGGAFTDVELTMEWYAVDTLKRMHEAPLIEAGKRLFDEQGRATIARIRRLNLFVTGPTLVKDPLLIQRIFPTIEEDARIEKIFPSALRSTMGEGYDIGSLRIGVQGETGTFNAQTARAIRALNQSISNIKGANETTQRRLLTLVQEWVTSEKPVDDLIDTVAGQFDMWSTGRAGRIGRTSTAAMFESGQLQSFEEAEVGKKAWLSTRDGKVRTGVFDHVAADGERVGLNEPFVMTGEALEHPADPAGSPGNIIECRCTSLPILEDEPE